MSDTFFHIAREKELKQEPFAMAFVVNRQIPSSGKPGDKAVITSDGNVEGWIGGGCTQGIVIKEAQAAIQDGKPRLVHISPEGEKIEESGVIPYNMTCHSGGMVKIYIEPVLPKPHILIMGRSHVAMALAKLAKAMGYTVSAMAADADPVSFPTADHYYPTGPLTEEILLPQTFIVVCTQGEQDEIMMEAALRSPIPYVAFVSSRRKANAIFKYLRDVKIPIERLQQVRTPAGMDIGAKIPEEVALSILAQIVQELRSEKEEEAVATPTIDSNSDIYINPVCEVPVKKSTAKHVLEYKGAKVYFCCDGCKHTFEQNPEPYTEKVLARG
ncbi:MAG: XdhC family protein [Bacteroidota bacterium]